MKLSYKSNLTGPLEYMSSSILTRSHGGDRQPLPFKEQEVEESVIDEDLEQLRLEVYGNI